MANKSERNSLAQREMFLNKSLHGNIEKLVGYEVQAVEKKVKLQLISSLHAFWHVWLLHFDIDLV